MSPDEKIGKREAPGPVEAGPSPEGPAPEDDGEGPARGERVLLNPEEWKEPAGRKVIGEYHKEGLPGGLVASRPPDRSDLDSFAEYWKDDGTSKLRSEYHKDGAPYMEAPSEWDGHRPRFARPPDKAAEKKAHESRERARGAGGGADGGPVRHGKGGEGSAPGGEGGIQSEGGGSAGGLTKHPLIERVLDVSTIEVLTFAMFRAIFGRGIRIPLKIEGVFDMEIVAKDKDIVVNTNQLYFQVPELNVWRFIFAYKGKPVIEYGRGVKNRIKIHRLRLFLVLLAVWWGGRRNRTAEKKKADAAAEAEARYASVGRGPKKGDGASKK